MENKIKSLGEKISPVLEEIELALLEHQVGEISQHIPLKFTENGFKAGLKIFMDIIMDEYWKQVLKEGISQIDAELKAKEIGTDIRKLIRLHLEIDTFKL